MLRRRRITDIDVTAAAASRVVNGRHSRETAANASPATSTGTPPAARRGLPTSRRRDTGGITISAPAKSAAAQTIPVISAPAR